MSVQKIYRYKRRIVKINDVLVKNISIPFVVGGHDNRGVYHIQKW